MSTDSDSRLKLDILTYIDRWRSSGAYKYNLTGRDAPGELELWLKEAWTTEQRLAAARAFDELKAAGLIQSAMSGNEDTDNWVTITPAGRDALRTGALKVRQDGPSKDKGLESDLSSDLEQGHPTAVIYSDLDNFKAVNDTLGHAAGDRCIEAFSEIVAAIVKGRGRVHRRYATGDEFVVVLPNHTIFEARATAERIRSAVESSKIGGDVPVTVSLGVCTSEVGAVTNAEDLINAADKMMLAAKRSKNAVESAETQIVHSLAPTPPLELDSFMRDSTTRWEQVVRERISAANPMTYYLTGTWSIAYGIAGANRQIEVRELLRALQKMPGQTRCMKPWHVPSKECRKPYPFKGMLECWPQERDDGYSSKYWRASPELKLFYLQAYDEDNYREDEESCLAGTEILVRNPIWRIGESVLHASRLRNALGLASGTVTFRAAWNKLKGRSLTFSLSKKAVETYTSQQESAVSGAVVAISDIETQLIELVAQLVDPLYECFGLFKVERDQIQSELANMLEKCG